MEPPEPERSQFAQYAPRDLNDRLVLDLIDADTSLPTDQRDALRTRMQTRTTAR